MFQPFHIQRWIKGTTLVGEPDHIPDDALRRATNVRLDRTLGIIEARPGWTVRTASAFASSVIYLSRLVAATVTVSALGLKDECESHQNLAEFCCFSFSKAPLLLPSRRSVAD